MNQKPHHLGEIFVIVFLISIIPSLIILKFFGFEIGIIFAICLATSIVATGFVGVENIIINKNKDL